MHKGITEGQGGGQILSNLAFQNLYMFSLDFLDKHLLYISNSEWVLRKVFTGCNLMKWKF